MAAGYALALHEYGHLPSGVGASTAVLEFSDWFAERSDWTLARAYRQWCVHIGELTPEASPHCAPEGPDRRAADQGCPRPSAAAAVPRPRDPSSLPRWVSAPFGGRGKRADC